VTNEDPVNVFYYPAMAASDSALKKALLFFDEIHFMDRASFFFGVEDKASLGRSEPPHLSVDTTILFERMAFPSSFTLQRAGHCNLRRWS
jgi:hypothetical protein